MARAVNAFWLFFSLQFVTYLNLTVDYRAVAHGQYAVVAVTNILAPVLGWVMIRRIGDAKVEGVGLLAVALGGAISSLLGMWLTRAWG